MKTILVILSFLAQILARKIKPIIAESIPTGMIRLHAPANFTIGYIGSQNIYVYWYEPMNYHLHLPLDIARLANNIGKTNINVTAVNDSVPNTDEVGYNVVTTLPEHDTSTKPGKTIKPMDWIGHSLVPYHLGQLNSYFLIWRKNGTESFTNQTLRRNQTEYHLSNLEPNTTYQIRVSAFYESLTYMKTEDVFVTTHALVKPDDSSKGSCYCDAYGTVEKKCLVITGTHVPHCTCKKGHTGLFCEKCAVSYFRTDIKGLCYQCPCNKTFSDGSCEFIEDKLLCSSCNKGYIGKHCQICDHGYWRSFPNEECKKCYCRGRSNSCDSRTGHCIGCSDHTVGYSCERCQADYNGDPINDKPCLHKDHVSLHTGSIVVGVCIGVLVFICGVVAFVLFRRWRKHPGGNKFWTVELRDDHERVNFSALPEDEIQARRMDYDFYQDQGGNRARDGSQKYSHLHEI